MLIMTQGKSILVNMDRVAEIYVCNTVSSAEVRYKDEPAGYSSLLGEYASVDRAKEVLAEIASSYKSYYEYILCANPFMFEQPKVYYMPAD